MAEEVQHLEFVPRGPWFALQGEPLLNGDSRVRLEMNTSFKSDIVGDLYWSINAFESFNSQPPEDQKKSDFGISATIGWTF